MPYGSSDAYKKHHGKKPPSGSLGGSGGGGGGGGRGSSVAAAVGAGIRAGAAASSAAAVSAGVSAGGKAAKAPKPKTPAALKPKPVKIPKPVDSFKSLTTDYTPKDQREISANKYKAVETSEVVRKHYKLDEKGKPVTKAQQVPVPKKGVSAQRIERTMANFDKRIAKIKPKGKQEERRLTAIALRRLYKTDDKGRLVTERRKLPVIKTSPEALQRDLHQTRKTTRQIRSGTLKPQRAVRAGARRIAGMDAEAFKAASAKGKADEKGLIERSLGQALEQNSVIPIGAMDDTREVMSKALETGPGQVVAGVLNQFMRPGAATRSLIGKSMTGAYGQALAPPEPLRITGDAAKRINEAPGPVESFLKGDQTSPELVWGSDLAEGLGLPKQTGIGFDLALDPLWFGPGFGAKMASNATGLARKVAAIERQAPDILKAPRYARLAKTAKRTGDVKPVDDYLTRAAAARGVKIPKFSLKDRRRAKAIHADALAEENAVLAGKLKKAVAGAPEIRGEKVLLPGRLAADATASAVRAQARNRMIDPGFRVRFTTPLGREIGSVPVPLPRKLPIPSISGRVGRFSAASDELADATELGRILGKEAPKLDRELKQLQALRDAAKADGNKALFNDLEKQIANKVDEVNALRAGAQARAHTPGIRALPRVETLGDRIDRLNRTHLVHEGGRMSSNISRVISQDAQRQIARITAPIIDNEASKTKVWLYQQARTDMGDTKLLEDTIGPLNATEAQVVDELGTFMEAVGKHGQSAGTLNNMIENYATRIVHHGPVGTHPGDTPVRAASDSLGGQMQGDIYAARHRTAPEMASLADRNKLSEALRTVNPKLTQREALAAADTWYARGTVKANLELLARRIQRQGPVPADDLTPAQRTAVEWGSLKKEQDDPLVTMRSDGVDPATGDELPAMVELGSGAKVQGFDAADEIYEGLTEAEQIAARISDAEADLQFVKDTIKGMDPKSAAAKQWKAQGRQLSAEVKALKADAPHVEVKPAKKATVAARKAEKVAKAKIGKAKEELDVINDAIDDISGRIAAAPKKSKQTAAQAKAADDKVLEIQQALAKRKDRARSLRDQIYARIEAIDEALAATDAPKLGEWQKVAPGHWEVQHGDARIVIRQQGKMSKRSGASAGGYQRKVWDISRRDSEGNWRPFARSEPTLKDAQAAVEKKLGGAPEVPTELTRGKSVEYKGEEWTLLSKDVNIGTAGIRRPNMDDGALTTVSLSDLKPWDPNGEAAQAALARQRQALEAHAQAAENEIRALGDEEHEAMQAAMAAMKNVDSANVKKLKGQRLRLYKKRKAAAEALDKAVRSARAHKGNVTRAKNRAAALEDATNVPPHMATRGRKAEKDYGGRLPDSRETDLWYETDPLRANYQRTQVEALKTAMLARWQGLDQGLGMDLAEVRGSIGTLGDGSQVARHELTRVWDKGEWVGWKHKQTKQFYNKDEIDFGGLVPTAYKPSSDARNLDPEIWVDPSTGREYRRPIDWDSGPFGQAIQESIGSERVWPTDALLEAKVDMMKQAGPAGNAYSALFDQGVENAFQRFMQFYRFAVTSPWPAYHIRNMISDAIKSVQADAAVMLHPRTNARLAATAAGRGKYHNGKWELPGFPEMSTEEMLLMFDVFGIRSTQHLAEFMHLAQTGKFPGRLRRSAANPGPKGRTGKLIIEGGARREDVVRFQTFLQRLRRNNGDVADAAWYMIQHHFDYSDLPATQRRWARSLFLFYTWYRRNIPLQLIEMVRRPFFFSSVGNTYSELALGGTPLNQDWSQLNERLPDMTGPAKMRGLVPDYVRSALGGVTVPWNDSTATISFNPPWNDVQMVSNAITDPGGQGLAGVTQLLNPGLTLLMQLKTGKDLITNRDFENNEPIPEQYKFIADALGVPVIEDENGNPRVPWQAAVAMRNLPWLGRGSSYLIEPSIDDADDTGWVAQNKGLLSYGLGLNVGMSPPESREAQYKAKVYSDKVAELWSSLSFGNASLTPQGKNEAQHKAREELRTWAEEHNIPKWVQIADPESPEYKSRPDGPNVDLGPASGSTPSLGGSDRRLQFDSPDLPTLGSDSSSSLPTLGTGASEGTPMPNRKEGPRELRVPKGLREEAPEQPSWNLPVRSFATDVAQAAGGGNTFAGTPNSLLQQSTREPLSDREVAAHAVNTERVAGSRALAKVNEPDPTDPKVRPAVRAAKKLDKAFPELNGAAAAIAGAAAKYKVSAPVLASIYGIETAFGTNTNDSTAGAQGPMQFMPATWGQYGVNAPGGKGAPDIQDTEDAIYSAANYLAASGFANDPQGAIFAYNHADWYVEDVINGSKKFETKLWGRAAGAPTGGAPKVEGPKRQVTLYKRIVAEAQKIDDANLPYVYGAAHVEGKIPGPKQTNGYDCSSVLSRVFQKAGVPIDRAYVSGDFGSIPGMKPGPGAVTVYYNGSHVFAKIGDTYFGTSSADNTGGGGFMTDATGDSEVNSGAYNVAHLSGLGKLKGFSKLSGDTGSAKGITYSPDGTTATVDQGSAIPASAPTSSRSPIGGPATLKQQLEFEAMAPTDVASDMEDRVAGTTADTSYGLATPEMTSTDYDPDELEAMIEALREQEPSVV